MSSISKVPYFNTTKPNNPLNVAVLMSQLRLAYTIPSSSHRLPKAPSSFQCHETMSVS